jgi:hypothetical protein
MVGCGNKSNAVRCNSTVNLNFLHRPFSRFATTGAQQLRADAGKLLTGIRNRIRVPDTSDGGRVCRSDWRAVEVIRNRLSATGTLICRGLAPCINDKDVHDNGTELTSVAILR